jgi:hypothetical protein
MNLKQVLVPFDTLVLFCAYALIMLRQVLASGWLVVFCESNGDGRQVA